MLKTLLSLFGGSKNRTTSIIVVVSIIALLLFNQFCGSKVKDPGTSGNIVQIDSDTTWNESDSSFQIVYDTILQKVAVPEYIVKTVIDTVYIHDTLLVLIDGDFVDSTDLFVMETTERDLLIYDSVHATENYNLFYHIESFGEIRSFEHRLEYKIPDSFSEIKAITETKTILVPELDPRKWMLMFEGIARTDFTTWNRVEYYAGGSIIRTKKSVAFGAGYFNQIKGGNHIFKATIGIRF